MLHKYIWKYFTLFTNLISQTHTYNAHISLLITVGGIGAATGIALLHHRLNPTGAANITLIYILTVILISYHTDKYRYGILAAIISVFFINYLFTYPFYQLNFTITGYPFTFLFMYVISILTSATTFHLKDQARKLNEGKKLIMEAEKEKLRANLLRAISHDLRTPLTSMIGASSSYLENESRLSAGQKRELISHIYEDANWLLHMVENLLSVTRITDTGAAPLKKTPEMVEEVVFDAVNTARKRYPEMQVQVSIPDTPLIASMDPLLIKQVILNLVENAWLHAKSEEPTQCYLTDDPSTVSIHVRDFGPGIPEEKLSSIFDATSSAPSSASDTRKGMGIGLSICKTIVNAHGGNIHAVNHAVGAEFYFTLSKEG